MNRTRSKVLLPGADSKRAWAAGLLILAVLAVVWFSWTGTASAQPPYPIIYEGSATIGGKPAPDGTKITARVGRAESPRPVEVVDGKYNTLLVDPSLEYEFVEDVVGLTITFYADGVRAVETHVFVEGTFLERQLDLNFPELPQTGDQIWGNLWLVLGAAGLAAVAGGALLLVLRPRKRGPGLTV
ncbi:MAG: hypothetical protein IH860_01920 [Chloroflexi bacterium]|nr:hypothetical protein [Chloroflexota bacterium]